VQHRNLAWGLPGNKEYGWFLTGTHRTGFCGWFLCHRKTAHLVCSCGARFTAEEVELWR
jgi:hypothetical protein